MIASLAEAERTVAATLSGASDIAARNGDKLTEDLCVERGRVHEKFAWLLESAFSSVIRHYLSLMVLQSFSPYLSLCAFAHAS